MQLLIDTHVILWFQASNNKLSAAAKQLIENVDNQCYISMASLWEMSIKIALGKLQIGTDYNSFYNYLLTNHFKILNIESAHLNILINLPHHHKDPFDRLLIAQAITDNLTIISADQRFKSYPVNVIW